MYVLTVWKMSFIIFKLRWFLSFVNFYLLLNEIVYFYYEICSNKLLIL